MIIKKRSHIKFPMLIVNNETAGMKNASTIIVANVIPMETPQTHRQRPYLFESIVNTLVHTLVLVHLNIAGNRGTPDHVVSCLEPS